MPKQRLNKDRPLTNLEKQHRFQDAASSIDAELDKALSEVNWKRRRAAEKDFCLWVKTYCVGLLIDDEPPQKGNEILKTMDYAMTSHRNYLICMGRGMGKSCYVLCKCLNALAVGQHKLIVLISNNSRAASGMLQDLSRAILQEDTTFAQDYPEVTLPFSLSHGSFRRRQLYNGNTTNIEKNSTNLVLATLTDKKTNKPMPCSGAAVTMRGLNAGLRGLRRGRQRVSAVILDDLQDAEIAENPEQVQKVLNLINKDIMPMAGKERLSILQTATPIVPDDVVDKLRGDSNWICQTYPVIEKFPDNMDLWKSYFDMFDAENVAEKEHVESLQFYKDNFDEMNKGSVVFNPSRYSEKDGHISAIQKSLEFQHMIGDEAFAAECQMQPKSFSYSLAISPKTVSTKIGTHEQLEVPDGYTYVVASSDLNLSFCISTTICAYKPDMTAVVLTYIFRKCNIDGKSPTTEYNQRVYEILSQHGRELKALGIHIDAWSIDCNGVPFDAVTQFTKSSMQICGLTSCGFIGKASHIFNGFIRSRLRNEYNRTVLCGSPEEHIKAGSGKKYVFWDSDLYKEAVQKAFLAEIGSAGSIALWKSKPEEHTDFAIQICNERLKLVKHRQDGRNQYFWKTLHGDHDMLDSLAQNMATAASQGMSSSNFNTSNMKRNTIQPIKKRRVTFK